MGLFIHNGKILETDSYEDGYAGVRAIEKEEQEFKRRVEKYRISDAQIKKIVREVLIEEGLIEPQKIKHNPYDDNTWALIRECVKGDNE